jgi:hypothetical protein
LRKLVNTLKRGPQNRDVRESTRLLLESLESRFLLTATLTIDPGAQTESQGAVISFPITLSEASATDITLQYVTADHSDQPWRYDHADGQIVIPAGQTSASIDLAVFNDDVWNPTLNFNITVSSADDVLIPSPSAGGTITNDDLGHFTYYPELPIFEGGNSPVSKLFVADGPPGGPIPITVTKISGGDAIKCNDSYMYTPSPFVGLVIAPYSEYDADQINDSATFEISSPGFATYTFVVNQTDMTPDAPDLVGAFDDGASNTDNNTSLNNSDANHVLQFTIGNTVPGSTVKLYADGTQIGSATASGTTTTITTTGNFTLADGVHQITASQYNNTPPGAPSAALELTIDTSIPILSYSDAEAFEADGVISFPVSINKPSASDITLFYFPTPNVASYDDMDFADNALIIPAGQTTGTINLTIYNDTMWEKNEGFYLSIFSLDVEIPTEFVNGTIKNDDLLHFSFFSQLFVNEGQFLGNTKLRLIEFPSVDLPVTITKISGDDDIHVSPGGTIFDASGNNYILVDPSADQDADDVAGTATFEITAPGAETYTFTVTEIDDDVVAPSPDLNWTSLSFTPTSGPAGTALSVNRTYQVATQSTSNFTIKYVLSSDATYGNGDDIVIGSETISGAGGSLGTHAGTFNNAVVPLGTAAGAYHLLAALDSGDAIVESNEGNNVGNGGDFTVSPPAQISVNTGAINVTDGSSSTFNVKLTQQPLNNVAVSVARTSGDTDLSADKSMLTFTPDNWNIPQTVTVSATLDFDVTANPAIFSVSATGMTTAEVAATEISVAPGIPAGVQATNTHLSKVTVSWNPLAKTTGYQIYRSTIDDFATAAILAGAENVTDTLFDDTSVVPETNYYYWVRGKNGASVGLPSVSELGNAVGVGAGTGSTIKAPKPAAFYKFGQSITLGTSLKALVNIHQPFTGNVNLVDSGGPTTLATAAIKNTAATFKINNLAPGTYSCVVDYAGDANYAASSSSAFTITVNKAATTTTLKSSVGAPVFGQAITLTATVNTTTAKTTARTGTVTFFEDGVQIGSPVAAANSIASATFTPATPGVHKYTAVYSGDSNFNGSNSATLSRNVQKAKTTVTLVSSLPNPIAFSDPIDLTATVSVVAPGASTPTGTITFRDNGKILQTVAIDGSGVAQIIGLTYNKAGNHNITATYNGDANDKTATKSLVLKILLIS